MNLLREIIAWFMVKQALRMMPAGEDKNVLCEHVQSACRILLNRMALRSNARDSVIS